MKMELNRMLLDLTDALINTFVSWIKYNDLKFSFTLVIFIKKVNRCWSLNVLWFVVLFFQKKSKKCLIPMIWWLNIIGLKSLNTNKNWRKNDGKEKENVSSARSEKEWVNEWGLYAFVGSLISMTTTITTTNHNTIYT